MEGYHIGVLDDDKYSILRGKNLTAIDSNMDNLLYYIDIQQNTCRYSQATRYKKTYAIISVVIIRCTRLIS